MISRVPKQSNFAPTDVQTHHPETRKPSFRWLGRGEQVGCASAKVLAASDTKKRSFGTDLTNTCIKRSKLVFPVDVEADQILNSELLTQVKREHSDCNVDRKNLGQGSVQEAKNYQFGPFAPVNVQKPVKQVRDWEGLASTYRPQYHNQALTDLFGHYMEAWKSWYSEVAGKDPIQATS